MSAFSSRGLRPISKILVPTVFVFLLLITYLLDWWAVRFETKDKYGNVRYRLVAQINWSHHKTEHFTLKPQLDSIPGNNRPEAHASLHHSINQSQIHPTKLAHLLPTAKPTFMYPNKISQSYKSPSDMSKFVGMNIPSVHVPMVDCKALAKGDVMETLKAVKFQNNHPKKATPNENFIHLASDCGKFVKSRHYATEPLSEEEAEFPIAYSLLIFKDIEQVERLLRAIYRPQNFYCVHVDAKASSVIWEAMRSIVRCFDNVFLSSKSVNVKWATFTVLEPELICMADLWKYRWKYFINLTGQEFPLKTNWDIVKILKALNGANNAEGTIKRRNPERTKYVHPDGFNPDKSLRKQSMPIQVRLTKGSVHIIVQRGFVDYILHDQGALDFLQWVKDTGVPDETFFSSLIYSPNLNIPGAYKGIPETDKIDDPFRPARNPFLARFKNWGTWPFNWKCEGQRVRMVCIFGVGDLKMLANRRELFANKFYIDYHPLVYDCLEEIHFNRTRDEVLGKVHFDASYYSSLDIVKNHVE